MVFEASDGQTQPVVDAIRTCDYLELENKERGHKTSKPLQALYSNLCLCFLFSSDVTSNCSN